MGPKVADCVLLFSLDKLDAFVVDVWLKRAILEFYPRYFDPSFVEKVYNKKSITDTEYDKINSFARKYFGKYSGYAQQYLFYYRRPRKPTKPFTKVKLREKRKLIMDTSFCNKWKGSGIFPENKYCRICDCEVCSELWRIVKELASKNDYEGIVTETETGKPYRLFTTPRQSKDICKFQSLSSDRKGVSWNIPKEDFLYVLKTGKNNTPSQTRQMSHVKPIIDLIMRSKRGGELVNLIKDL